MNYSALHSGNASLGKNRQSVRLSARSWLYLGLSLSLAHCARAEREDDGPDQPRSPTGGSAPTATGGTPSSGGSPGSGGFFSPSAGGRASSSGGSVTSGGSKASGGVPANGGSGGRASGGSISSGGRTTSGGSSASGGRNGVDGGKGGEAPVTQGGSSGTGGSAGSPFPATCSDGKRGGSETAIDCGGATCAPCDEGKACVSDYDCESTQCRDLTCAPDHCGDGAPSGDESDADCGGSCLLCALGQSCDQGSDCVGNNCNAGTCGEPAHCAYGWADDPCGETCLERTQSDQLACVEVLDCFVENDCGPSTCTSPDAACGSNKLHQGSAPYPYAAEVYDCLCQ